MVNESSRHRRTVCVLSLSRFCPNFPENRVRCLSCCLDSVRVLVKSCPWSARAARQGRDRAVRNFTVLVRRRLDNRDPRTLHEQIRCFKKIRFLVRFEVVLGF